MQPHILQSFYQVLPFVFICHGFGGGQHCINGYTQTGVGTPGNHWLNFIGIYIQLIVECCIGFAI